ncbi:FadR/GntR family transcriptional regulator [Williamsia sp.]|uniref:FadR/GntR family transcriptional regulator n=1 Tax=Williamsia sp. TaxID=1872085 RepID=UPI002F91F5D3
MDAGDGDVWSPGGTRAGKIVRAPKASEKIADLLRGQIVRGEIATGQMLPPEKTLIQNFGVSRPTLREAFRILESEGLISVVTGSHGGPQARLPGLDVASRHIGQYLQVHGTTLADLLEARSDFETACVRHLANRCPPAGMRALKACVDANRLRLAQGVDDPKDFATWVGLTGDFHELIAQYCGNTTLAVQVGVLHDVLAAHRRMGIRQRTEDAEMPSRISYAPRVVAGYQTLVELVEAKDARGAVDHWRRHLEEANEVIYRNRDRNATIDLFE